MNENEFWTLIEKSKKKSKNDFEKQLELLVSDLTKLTEGEIFEFDRIFNKYHVNSYTSELWAAAYIINGGCSDDSFDYFRAWLISQGRSVYENALKDPQSLVNINEEDVEDFEFEDFLYVSGDAYKLKTGKDDFYDRVERQEYPEINLNWSEDDGSLEKMYPKLIEKYC